MPEQIFISGTRSKGELAGVFEFDGETSYFYLYCTNAASGEKIKSSIHIFSGDPDFTPDQVSVRWDVSEEKVGLFIKQRLWAVFDPGASLKYGGNYYPGRIPNIPPEATIGFV